MSNRGLTSNHTSHLLEWGVSGLSEWLWVRPLEITAPKTLKLSFHLQNHHRMDTFVKTALFWRLWLKGSRRPRRIVMDCSRRWSTITALACKPDRFAEWVDLNGLTLNGSTQNLIDLVRPRRFDYTRWHLTMRSQRVVKCRRSLYLTACSALTHESYQN